MNPFKFVGPRVIKTGIAVFITALICVKLELPVIFAVITAIVTTEPTAADSLKRGIIRLPAAAIGASFALIFDLFLGNGAMTFALVSMLTILFCHHLKLDNGTLVATLTAVAMIPGVSDGIVTEFLLRLSGTSLGIIISTLVNFAVLPPKFGPLLVNKVNNLYKQTSILLNDLIQQIILANGTKDNQAVRNLFQELEKAFEISAYQEAEWNYRKSNTLEERSFHFLQKKLKQLQKLINHVSNLNDVDLISPLSFSEKKVLIHLGNLVNELCQNPFKENKLQLSVYQDEIFTMLKKEMEKTDGYCQKKAFFYEVLAIVNCFVILQKITTDERMFSDDNENYPSYVFPKQVQYD